MYRASRRIARHALSQLAIVACPEHLFEQLHRQTDNVGLTAKDDMNPSEAILVPECAGLVYPATAGQVIIQLGIGEGIHAERCDRDTRYRAGQLRVADGSLRIGDLSSRVVCVWSITATQRVAGRGSDTTLCNPWDRGYLVPVSHLLPPLSSDGSLSPKWPDADTGVDAMLSPAEQFEHLTRVFLVPGFAEDLAAAFRDGVGGDDDGGPGIAGRGLRTWAFRIRVS